MSEPRSAPAAFASRSSWQQGKTLVEFALLIPVILALLIGIIDLGRILFTYAQAVNQLREGLRYAEVLGYSTTHNYLDCTEMRDTISDVYFAEIDRSEDITIMYINAQSPDPARPITHICAETGSVVADDIESGDILKISMTARLPILVIPGETLEMSFSGQRTIIKSIKIGSLIDDGDQDGLNDLWEASYFAQEQNALDDPDSDGCNNGCEEIRGTDPTVNDAENVNPALTAGMTVPDAPTGFVANRNCANERVTFSWTAPTGSFALPFHVDNRPFPDVARIYRVGNPVPVLEINPVMTGTCQECASLSTNSASTAYYLVFYKNYRGVSAAPGEAGNWTVRSAASTISTATCDPPAAPAFFTAQADCVAGMVNFSWQPPSPRPDAYEIYRTDGTLVQTIRDGGDNVCRACDTIGKNEARQYWIVARLGTQSAASLAPFAEARCGSGIVSATPSPLPDDGTPLAETAVPDPPLLATPFPGGCGSSGPQGGRYRISGHIFLDENRNGQQASVTEPNLGGIGVRIIWAGEDHNFDTVCDNGNPIDQYSNEAGNFLFAGLKPGLYRIELIRIEDYDEVTTRNYPYPNITLGPDYTLTFGLR